MAKRIPPRHQNKPKIKLKIKIKKDDNVKVIAGKDKGKTGRVLQVDTVSGKVLVEKIGLVKRHVRPNPQKQIKGGIAESERPIAISNVMVLTAGGVATRVGYRLEGAKYVRVAKKGGELLDKK
jgi:large subunit ribosomal protein L24